MACNFIFICYKINVLEDICEGYLQCLAVFLPLHNGDCVIPIISSLQKCKNAKPSKMKMEFLVILALSPDISTLTGLLWSYGWLD